MDGKLGTMALRGLPGACRPCRAEQHAPAVSAAVPHGELPAPTHVLEVVPTVFLPSQ